MKKLVALSLVVLFCGSLMAQGAPQQSNNNTASQATQQDKNHDKDKAHHRHHRHRHERKPGGKK